ncbi:MAG: carboxypeptidase-like regulatory domain-containing protein [Fermentimonas sp.]|nr:carboxypeptidase-like regulatory domain-containing protein [Fermentimonas sp.]
MMKNKQFGISLLVLLVTLIWCPVMQASDGDNQPNGKIITVSGYVTCKGERIPDVLVEAASTNEGTVSDKEGKFSINITKGSILTFQKDGYNSYEYMADEPRDNLIVCLLPENESGETGEQAVKEQQEETEAVIIIQTKKENKEE